MDFTKQLLTEKGEVYKAPETYLNEEGVNHTRQIELTYLRVGSQALLGEIKFNGVRIKSEYDDPENMVKRFDLHQKINENPENVELDEDEKTLLVAMVNIYFEYNAVMTARFMNEI